MAEHPLFSIITVTYNAESTLPVTLESVKRQTYRDFEYLIIDGASKDATLDQAKNSGIQELLVLSRPDHGIYDAMNRGLDMASGDYVIFLNSGDRFHADDVLEKYAEAIKANNKPGIVYGQTELMDNVGRSLGPRHLTAPEVLTLESFAEGMLVCHQAMAVLKRITSPYNLKYRFSADYEWVVRCLQHSRCNVYIPCTVVDYLYEGATTANRRRSLYERFRIMAFYYGLLPTIVRHLAFIPRFVGHKLKLGKIQKQLDRN
ncbi:MAG: glycosyltransferase [Muribaculaceae bacterium]|nr:glycosyltransferase [Muribaculaceae bacterium]